MNAKKRRRPLFDPSLPLAEWDASFWIGILQNALKLQRRIAKASRDGNRRRVRNLRRMFEHALAPHALTQLANDASREWNSTDPAPSLTADRRREHRG